MDPISKLESYALDIHQNQQNITDMYTYIDLGYHQFFNSTDKVIYIVLNRLASIVHQQLPDRVSDYLSIQFQNRPFYVISKLHRLHAECLLYLYMRNQPIVWHSVNIDCILYLIEEYHDMFAVNDLFVLNQILINNLNINTESSLSAIAACHFYRFELNYSSVIPFMSQYPIHVVDIIKYQSQSLKEECLNQIFLSNLNHRDSIYALRFLKSAININHVPVVVSLNFDFDDLQDVLSIINHCQNFNLDLDFIRSVVHKSFDILIENDQDDPNSEDLLSDGIHGALINLSIVLSNYPLSITCSDEQFIYYHWCIMYHLSQIEMVYELHPQAKHILTNVNNFESLFLASHIWHSFTLVNNHPVELLEIAMQYISEYLTEPQLTQSVLKCILYTRTNVELIVLKLYKSILILTRRLNQSNLVLVGKILNKLFLKSPLKLKSMLYINIQHLHMLDILQGVLIMGNELVHDTILKYLSAIHNDPYLVLKSIETASMINTENSMQVMHSLFTKYKSGIHGVFIANEMSLDHMDSAVTCMATILTNINRFNSNGQPPVVQDVFSALINLENSYKLEIDTLKELLEAINENVVYHLNPVFFEFLLPFCVYEEMADGIKYILSWSIIHSSYSPVIEKIAETVYNEFLQSNKFINVMPLICHLQPSTLRISVELESEKDLLVCKNLKDIQKQLRYYRLQHHNQVLPL